MTSFRSCCVVHSLYLQAIKIFLILIPVSFAISNLADKHISVTVDERVASLPVTTMNVVCAVAEVKLLLQVSM